MTKQQVLQQGVSHSTANVNSQDLLKMNVNCLGETAQTQCPKATEIHICFPSFILVLNFGKGVISTD